MTIVEAFRQISPTINRMNDRPERIIALLDIENIMRSSPHYLAELHVSPELVKEVTIDGSVVHLR